MAAVTRLIIDTDIGTDVDDLWTLAMVPALPNVVLEAVTVVYGDVELRARMAASALASMQMAVPVHAGVAKPRSGAEVLWAGHEGAGFDDLDRVDYSGDDAVGALISAAAREPGTLHVLAIGPLTNLAAAIERDPTFASNLGHLTLMGGETKRGWAEHNFGADAAATGIVLASGAPITIVPLDQTLRVVLTEPDIVAIARQHQLGELMEGEARRFWSWLATIVPSRAGQGSPAHDPLALLAIAAPELFTFEPSAVRLSPDGSKPGVITVEADEQSPVSIATVIDPAAAHHAILAALTAP